jgi:spermidine/putrescine ABC transporter ATP-binding subunit
MQGVQLNAVSKLYGETVAVKDLTLEIGAGEFLFLLGPSGAGKSTVLRLIGGYEMPTGGTIKIEGQDVTRLPVHQRNIGMVFQSYALFPHMNVTQNVAFGLKMRRVAKKELAEKVKNALELVELDGLGKRYPKQLSGGQQQRVALARAIVYQPSLLLLDEPLANLDRRLRDNMRLELKRLQRRIGITTIMVTHDQEESLSMADRIAVMHQGKLEQVGAPVEIYTKPAGAFVAGFIGEMNVMRGEVLAIAPPYAQIKVKDLTLSIPFEDEMVKGTEVTVCLRAEQIELSPNEVPQAPNQLPNLTGMIELVTYLGANTLYLVRVENRAVIFKVLKPNTAGQKLFNVGDKVQIGWADSSLTCFT